MKVDKAQLKNTCILALMASKNSEHSTRMPGEDDTTFFARGIVFGYYLLRLIVAEGLEENPEG